MFLERRKMYSIRGKRLLGSPKVVRKVVSRRINWNFFFKDFAGYFVVFSLPPGRRFENLPIFPVGSLLVPPLNLEFSNLFFFRGFKSSTGLEDLARFFNRGWFFMFVWFPKSSLFLTYSHVQSLNSFSLADHFNGRLFPYFFLVFSSFFVVFSRLLRFFFYAYFWTVSKKS